jgi:hypothetical protein
MALGSIEGLTMTDHDWGALLPAFLLLTSLALMVLDWSTTGKPSAR